MEYWLKWEGNMIETYKQYEPLFGEWRINKLIGKGSFGEVYEIERSNFGTKYKAALKIVTIPADEGEIQELMACGMTIDETKQYMEESAKHIVNEFELMSRLKGHTNIVSYEDHQVIERSDKMGWHIMMKMELLEPLNEYIKRSGFSAKDIARLGRDLATALSLCQKYQIIHRDIKPENIFVSPNGDFKLGDFGVARNVERATMGLSKKGTYTYMAPEIYRGENYTMLVDIYSLGIVMYKLANYNRIPFMPPYPEPVMYTDRENAFARRMKGDKLPNPIAINKGKLVDIIHMCCEFEPSNRYQYVDEIINDLTRTIESESEKLIIEPNIAKNYVKKIIIKDKEVVEDTAQINKAMIDSIVNSKDKSKSVYNRDNSISIKSNEVKTHQMRDNKRVNNRKIVVIIIGLIISILFILICTVMLSKNSENNYTTKPTPNPITKPTPEPVPDPVAKPTPEPVPDPIAKPTPDLVVNPTATPVVNPTETPVVNPTEKPVVKPTAKPVVKPTAKPVVKPVAKPTAKPVAKPTAKPVVNPTAKPTAKPTATPEVKPTATPEVKPTPESNQNKAPEILTDF